MAWRLWRRQYRPEACIRHESQTVEPVYKTIASNLQECFRMTYNTLFGIEKQQLNKKMDFMPVNSKKRTEMCECINDFILILLA
jgi:hypothetical protein